MDCKAFINAQKAFLVAPAGYGKTYTIAKCLENTNGRQLILTHTHAGISSIKEKIRNNPKISSSSYLVETISSFAQKYVTAFYTGNDIPDQEDSSYHQIVINKAIEISQIIPVQDVLRASYSGMFVDEYQDCTISQHNLIMVLSDIFRTRILGDHMQGIFEIKEKLNNFPSDLIKNGFVSVPELSTPYRWENRNKNELGETLKDARRTLELNNEIDLNELSKNPDIFFKLINSNSIYTSLRDGKSWLDKIINNPENNQDFNSVLLIVPEYEEINNGKKILKGTIYERVLIKQTYPSLVLLEALDHKDFYSLAKKSDNLISTISSANTPYKEIKLFLEELFNKTDLDEWLGISVKSQNGEYHFKKKTEDLDKKKSDKLRDSFELFRNYPTKSLLKIMLRISKDILGMKCARTELLSSILKSLEEAEFNNISVLQAMKDHRNVIRRIGRKTDMKCIGTTRLTKGLEFDTVVILNADKFDCPKHFYVALTRCCKKLIILSGSDKILFKKSEQN